MTNSPTSLLDFIRRRVGVGELVRRQVDWLPMGHSLNMIFLVQQSKTLPPLDNFHVVLESTSKLLDQLKNERFLKKVIWKYVIVKSNKP